MTARSEHVDDTIAAIATPPGEGGVAIVRLSGPEAIQIAARLFRSSTSRSLAQSKRPLLHGHVVDAQGQRLDEVLVLRMPAPHSYTREDVVEIHCHGGAGPVNAILEETLQQGARLAQPGEFTQRAFLNGRIDLVQAEAVIDQIRARTRDSLRAANAAAEGVLSREIHGMRDTLAQLLARIEAVVDFPEEDDVPELLDASLVAALRDCRARMEQLLASAEAGRLYREGALIAIVGRPNVGKSSLFNALLRDNRAIVTATAGTTRDRLEETLNLQGIPARLVDTAGMRQTEDEIERIGVDRARDTLRSADLILFVLDATTPPTPEDRQLAEELAPLETPVLCVWNKYDLIDSAAAAPTPTDLPGPFIAECPVSALTGAGLDALEAQLAQQLRGNTGMAADQPMLTRAHQKDSLRRAHACLLRADELLDASPEFLAFEIQETLQALGEITGETTPDEILGTIFASFCIGK